MRVRARMMSVYRRHVLPSIHYANTRNGLHYSLSLSLPHPPPFALQLAVCCYLVLCAISRTHLRVIAHVATRCRSSQNLSSDTRRTVLSFRSFSAVLETYVHVIDQSRCKPTPASRKKKKKKKRKKRKKERGNPFAFHQIFRPSFPRPACYSICPPPFLPLAPLRPVLPPPCPLLLTHPLSLPLARSYRFPVSSVFLLAHRAISSLLLRASFRHLFSLSLSLSLSRAHYEPALVATANAGFSYIFVRPRDVPACETGEARRLLHDGVAQS